MDLVRDRLSAYLLPGNHGIILGQLFPSSAKLSAPSSAALFPEDASEEIVTTSGRALQTNYWGKYVAFVNNPLTGERNIIRDCSGSMPCYRTAINRVEIVFSDVEDLDVLDSGDFAIDWNYLSAFIYSSDLPIRGSGLTNVYEVLAGERVSLSAGVVWQGSIWDPRDICSREIAADTAACAEMLRETAQICIGAWASLYDSIALSLSGGFDSAVVLGLVQKCKDRPSITCLNRYSDDCQGDERLSARAAAAH
jgi:asparagine synthase (glutamine-hydrolysing)